MKTILQTTILLLITLIQILKAQVINVTIPVVTVTPTATPTTITVTNSATITAQPNTNYFTDTEAVNTLVALIITILTAISTITAIVCTCKRRLAKKTQQVNRLNNQLTQPPGYQQTNLYA